MMKAFPLVLILILGGCGCPKVKPQPLPALPVPAEANMATVIVTQNRAQAIILNELLNTKTGKRHTRPMLIADLRRRTALSRPHFDAALLGLSSAGLVSLMRRDYSASASESERAEWLKVDDYYFHAVTLKE